MVWKEVIPLSTNSGDAGVNVQVNEGVSCCPHLEEHGLNCISAFEAQEIGQMHCGFAGGLG